MGTAARMCVENQTECAAMADLASVFAQCDERDTSERPPFPACRVPEGERVPEPWAMAIPWAVLVCLALWFTWCRIEFFFGR